MKVLLEVSGPRRDVTRKSCFAVRQSTKVFSLERLVREYEAVSMSVFCFARENDVREPKGLTLVDLVLFGNDRCLHAVSLTSLYNGQFSGR
jgi:hypothetical protein